MCVPKNRGGMGFRDIHCFNLAMLAKQCWRLIDQFDSLCARVLRSKYYPSGDILNCELKKGSSYVWQSIYSGIETINQGCIWRIGNGLTVNIWDDPWIPTSSSWKIVTMRGSSLLTMVHELIDPATGYWDETLIRDIFWGVDADRILQIPLSSGDMEDFVAW